jgi:hypothetical protein
MEKKKNLICPYCEEVIEDVKVTMGGKEHELGGKFTKRYFFTILFSCPLCKKIISVHTSFIK